MKRFIRKMTVLLLVMAILLSMLPAVLAKTGSRIANPGTRFEICTSLSSQAKAYYTGSYTYEKLSALSGAKNVTDSYAATQSNPLYTALYTLMDDTNNGESLTYSGTGSNSLMLGFYYTDTEKSVKNDTMNLFWCSDVRAYGKSVNREHVWPKSHASFKQRNGGSDLHHLRPADASVNTAHYHWPYGNAVNATEVKSKSGTLAAYLGTLAGTNQKCFEPLDCVKGDLARILLYVYVRWQQPNLYSNVAQSKLPPMDPDDDQNDGEKVIESLDVLLNWCKMDPVDTWEMGRNDAAERIQGNRNVFIDYPELAYLMFSKEIPKMTTPSGIANQQTTPTSYTVTWNVDGVKTTERYQKDATPSFKGSTYKAPDANYTYTFIGWSPAIQPVTADITYTAQYSKQAIAKSYTVTWNVDGVKTTEQYQVGATPSFKGSTYKAPDANYTYTFIGWSPAIQPVTTNITYTAQYSKAALPPKTYTITWYVGGKATRESYEKGEMPSFKGSTDKAADSQYTYIFIGWSPKLSPVTADATYTAQYSREAIAAEFYTVTWDVNGKTYTERYEAGKTPSFQGSTVRASDEKYSYAFIGWKPALKPVSADVTYTAQYEKKELKQPIVFTDVKESDWFADEVRRAAQLGLFDGVGDNRFDPEGQVSRAMLVTVLYRMSGKPAVTYTDKFTDVAKDAWYAEAVVWASNEAITLGTSSTTFSPDGAVTREQTAAFLYRYAAWTKADTSARAKIDGFADHDSVSNYASDAISWAVANKLLNGSQENGVAMLKPQGTATRAQAAAIMVRFCETFAK